ncbi:MAG: hypothetical protein JRG97_15630 [Deltaproteobacteria bacterium]|nr:hypothetical protein [Deltaproteobacteria bacterium]MBW2142464.1 hypothetical protein [Deltaproteobacteria bacterium]
MLKPEKREIIESRVLQILVNHVGQENAIDMGDLYERVFKKSWKNKINDTRPLRDVIEKLRWRGVRICSDCAGYFVASCGSELDDYLSRTRRRHLKGLAREAAMRRITLHTLLGQMQLNLTGDRNEPA